jgi:glycosyltransferase involved in cell wall biosynthesis
MTSAPLISISLPLYNAAHELEARLDNLAAQTFGDFQALMVDSGSTDGTAAIGRRYAARDSRFKYFRSGEKLPYNRIVLQNIYRGLDSRYLVLTSHGQRWAPTYLEECLKTLERNPQALAAYSWCRFMGADNEEWPAGLPGGLHRDDFDLSGPDPARRLLNVIEHQEFCTPFFGLIRSGAYFQNRLRLENLVWEHLATALLALNGPLIQIEKPLLFRRWQPMEASWLDIHRHYLNRPMELKPAPCSSDCFGYKSFFFSMLLALVASLYDAAHLDSRQKESLAGQSVGAFIRRYRKELTAELDAAIERVARGWFYVWRGVPTAEVTDKSIMPTSLSGEDGDSPPPRPNLDLSVARRINAFLNCCLAYFPTHPGLYYALGLTYRRLGRLAEARTALEIETRNNPGYEPARRTLREWEGAGT